MTSLSTGARSKPILDEAGFQQLLAAAYVLQQHNDTMRSKDPRLDAAWIFSEIAETQNRVRQRGIGFSDALTTIAADLRRITTASGTSICLMQKGALECVANSGSDVAVPGGSIVSNSLVGAERLRNSREFHSSDALRDTRLDITTCRALNIGSVLALPIQSSADGGVLEVRWSKPDGFHDCDVRTCELMAGLVTELLHKQVATTKDALPAQHGEATIAADLDRNVASESTKLETDVAEPKRETASDSATPQVVPDPLATECRVCGRPFRADEAFCGNCSMPRVACATNQNLQSKWASMWFMQQAQDGLQDRRPQHETPLHTTPARQPFVEAQKLKPVVTSTPASGTTTQSSPPVLIGDHVIFEHVPNLEKEQSLSLWTQPNSATLVENESAPGINAYLQHLLANLRSQAGSSGKAGRLGFIAGALILMLVVWGFWSAPANSSQLTWFESLLVELGLAEAPPRAPVVQSGDPNIRVWLDVHTGLYYCPGSDLYGKTPGGRFSKQKAAQEDQFEPATRVVCQ